MAASQLRVLGRVSSLASNVLKEHMTSCTLMYLLYYRYDRLCMIHSHTGPPSAPSISDTGNTVFSSFNLTISHPTTSEICVQEYNLVVRQEGVVVSNNTFMRNSLQDDRFIDLMAIDNSLTVRTCEYTYTFELTPVGGSMSSGVQPGDPNFNGMFFLIIINIIETFVTHSIIITLELCRHYL